MPRKKKSEKKPAVAKPDAAALAAEAAALKQAEAAQLDELEPLEARVRELLGQYQQTRFELAQAVAVLKASLLWRVRKGSDGKALSWEAYCAAHLGISRAESYREIKAVEVWNELSPVGDEAYRPDTVDQLLALERVPPEQRPAAVDQAVQRARQAGLDRPEQRHFNEAVTAIVGPPTPKVPREPGAPRSEGGGAGRAPAVGRHLAASLGGQARSGPTVPLTEAEQAIVDRWLETAEVQALVDRVLRWRRPSAFALMEVLLAQLCPTGDALYEFLHDGAGVSEEAWDGLVARIQREAG